MAYVIDRQRALRMKDIVAVHPIRKGRSRSQVVLQDNSLYWTLTRPRTFLRVDAELHQGLLVTVK